MVATSHAFVSSSNADDTPNFSHYPAGEDPNIETSSPRFYHSSSSINVSPLDSITTKPAIPPPHSPSESNSPNPALPLVAQQAFTAMSDSLLPTPRADWNPSELGIVHLPSIASSSREPSKNDSDRTGSPQSSEAGFIRQRRPIITKLTIS
ncbi:hypothetical protein BDP27DRAFT_787735 [Rhodocollybia butyracea]|uniref:Uncharacterized protein n=1 Tax=Rhodocollybia butyracea TaxID=206335 RepID=A0A9P5PSP3_9AGAR|nr:hypothetical protein BDP27DRAFT_787735 [Rhodocollybia butyracea]